ncbi:MAG: ATP-grasp domain-containing protein, partial [Deinococcus sp.]|nr:ATP-grasp domain-containing protein [Deinococcus sp.]
MKREGQERSELTLGILGGGQLAQMLALDALPLGVRVVALEPDPQAGARLCAEHLCAPYTDPAGLARLAECSAVTLEFENVPVEALEYLEGRVPVRPGAGLLAHSKHRAREKEGLRAAGAGTADFAVIEGEGDLNGALERVGGQGILKTSELGYDGKGQRRVSTATELAQAWDDLGRVPCVLEGLVPFVREVSVGVARTAAGELAFGPLVENVHRSGILRTSVYAGGDERTAQQARDIARRVAEAWGLEGLMTLEFCELPGGALLVNEVAPRVHNSG